MDGGNIYRRGSSITSSLAGSLLPFTSTPTPSSSFVDPAPPVPRFDSYAVENSVAGPSIHQKMDQLLFLLNEERRDTSELKAAVLKLTEQMEEIRQQQERMLPVTPSPCSFIVFYRKTCWKDTGCAAAFSSDISFQHSTSSGTLLLVKVAANCLLTFR